MARDFTPLATTIWTNHDFTNLSVPAQLLYLTAISHPTITYAGVLDWRPNRIAALSPTWDTDTIKAAADELQAGEFLIIDEDTEEAFVRSMYRNDQYLKMRNLGTTTARDIAKVASRTIHAWITRELHRLRDERPWLKGFESEELQDYMHRNPAEELAPKGDLNHPQTPPQNGGETGHSENKTHIHPSVNPAINPSIDPQKLKNNPTNGGSNGGSPTTYNMQYTTQSGVYVDQFVTKPDTNATTPHPDQQPEHPTTATSHPNHHECHAPHNDDTDPTPAMTADSAPAGVSVPEAEPTTVDGWARLLEARQAQLAFFESPSASRCEEHVGVAGVVPPCGACGAARRLAADRVKSLRIGVSEARRGLVGCCTLCDEFGLVKTAVSGVEAMERCTHGVKPGELAAGKLLAV